MTIFYIPPPCHHHFQQKKHIISHRQYNNVDYQHQHHEAILLPLSAVAHPICSTRHHPHCILKIYTPKSTPASQWVSLYQVTAYATNTKKYCYQSVGLTLSSHWQCTALQWLTAVHKQHTPKSSAATPGYWHVLPWTHCIRNLHQQVQLPTLGGTRLLLRWLVNCTLERTPIHPQIQFTSSTWLLTNLSDGTDTSGAHDTTSSRASMLC